MIGKQLAEKLKEVSYAYDIFGESRRAFAFTKAAISLEETVPDEDLSDYSMSRLQRFKDVGKGTAQAAKQFMDTGTCDRLKRLKNFLPAGVFDILKIRGLGPKTARRLVISYEIKSLGELVSAIDKRDELIYDSELRPGAQEMKRQALEILAEMRTERAAIPVDSGKIGALAPEDDQDSPAVANTVVRRVLLPE